MVVHCLHPKVLRNLLDDLLDSEVQGGEKVLTELSVSEAVHMLPGMFQVRLLAWGLSLPWSLETWCHTELAGNGDPHALRSGRSHPGLLIAAA